MPKHQTPQIHDPELYDRLRDEGHSQEKAARIANAAANEGRNRIGHKGGKASDYSDRTVKELRARAKELGLHGYSNLRKKELIQLLQDH